MYTLCIRRCFCLAPGGYFIPHRVYLSRTTHIRFISHQAGILYRTRHFDATSGTSTPHYKVHIYRTNNRYVHIVACISRQIHAYHTRYFDTTPCISTPQSVHSCRTEPTFTASGACIPHRVRLSRTGCIYPAPGAFYPPHRVHLPRTMDIYTAHCLIHAASCTFYAASGTFVPHEAHVYRTTAVAGTFIP